MVARPVRPASPDGSPDGTCRAGLDERGRLPAAEMPGFWETSIAAGEVTEARAESKFLDRRLIDSFDDWAP